MRPGNTALFSLRLLLHERSRLAASIGGIAFALLLMLLQVGFRNALLDSSLELLRQIDADILVVHKEKHPFLSRQRIAAERLYQALSVEGVESAHPLWMALQYWTNLERGTQQPIRLIGIDPRRPVLLIPEVNAALERLKTPGTALLDERSRDSYGYLGEGPAQVGTSRIEIVGNFPLGSDFEVDGNLILGEETFLKLAHSDRQKIELAALKLAPGADVEEVQARLSRVLPGDTLALTKAQLIERDLDYWKKGTPISIILLVGVALGFAVGVVICYQILYTDVLDHLPEFATMKAIGYGDRHIQGVVIVQAWVLSILGFFPAVVLGGGTLGLLAALSGLPTGLALRDALTIGALSIAMCTLAGALALRKVRLVDPAELF